ncbi:uncharacterized protein LOC132730628 [Ruditapes philippinarum]|uniref:uncharacterized protein LOC132730628 n=1 Tax=Ruditapes philippinarum TaxID=129788 RepID=UPI00295C2CE3|nr:uncharacterized protein LOC132730628 [Ruditapes philippinarum]
MSIVLPRRKRKTDIFAPRKSVQDAKEKLGPAFFDPSLLECSRNAVELNKLVNKWDDIDKQKIKVIRDLSREQNALAKSFKRNHSFTAFSTKDLTSEDCIVTLDGRPIPPGFRFKSNGEFKVSTTSLSVIPNDEETKSNGSEIKLTHTISAPYSKRIPNEEKSNQSFIDCNREIAMLRGVIVDICEELSKSKISLSKSNSGHLKSFLRAHSNEYISVSDFTGETYEKPNDRFAFQPGSSERRNLYKQRIYTPSSRACTGCQFRLKQENDELQKLKNSSDKSILKRRWSYVPTGKYISSSANLNMSTHLMNSCSLTNDMKSMAESKPSMVQFKVDSEINPRKAVSFQHKSKEDTRTDGRTKSSPCIRQTTNSESGKYYRSAPLLRPKHINSKPTESCQARSPPASWSNRSASKSGLSAYSETRRLGLNSSLSTRSAGLESRQSSRLLADYDSRLNLLKQYQAEQEKECESKVKKFLNDIKSSK